MKRSVIGLALAVAIAGCAATKKPAKTPEPGASVLGQAYDAAAEVEQRKPANEAIGVWLDLVDRGVAAGQGGTAAVVAGVDALVWRDAGLGRVAGLQSLAFRVPGAFGTIEPRLSAAYDRATNSPIARLVIAQAMVDLARVRGDAGAAATWRARTGTAQHASAVGPLAWTAVEGVDRPTALEGVGVPLAASYPGAGPFAARVAPVPLEADDGSFDVTAIGTQAGTYALAFDLHVAKPGRVAFALRSTSAAVLVVGGKVAATRPYALGGSNVVRFGEADLPAGVARVVVRVGVVDDGGRVGVAAIGEDGAPVPIEAAKVGEPAPVAATSAEPFAIEPVGAEDLAAATLLALGDARGARRVLETTALKEDVAPARALLFARAIASSYDVPEPKRIERTRTAYGRALAAWPDSWEAIVGNAFYAAARKGPGEGRVESLRDLAKTLGEKSTLDPVVRAFVAATAIEAGVRDVALESFEAVKQPLAGTPFLHELDDKVHPRTGAEAETFACDDPARDRQSLACLQQKAKRGDAKGVFAEIARLRELRGSPRALLGVELSERLADGDVTGGMAIYDHMLAGEKNLAALGAIPRGEEAAIRDRLNRDMLTARDTPGQIQPTLRLLGEDPAPKLEEEAMRLVTADRAHPAQTSAATLVLRHDETYELQPSGLLRVLIHDVRRVAGTTDVEQGAGGTSYAIVGRETRRVLRRKILKKDGRVLEPDRASYASQGNADLSQLEPGDYIEQIVEGFALPDRAGHVVVDGPDLLPERTSVAKATIELRAPKKLALARWSHALLGKPTERDEGDVHVVRWDVKDAQPRRIEEGVPRMDRDVCVSFGTYTWKDVGAEVAEEVRALEDKDPYVARWAKEAVPNAAPNADTVERLVVAAGKTIKVANGSMLSDIAASLYSGSQQTTARSILELGQGSRTWVIFRALEELGIPAEIVLAEREPFSADPAFPARPARFDHPLVVAHVQGSDVWIDADVNGPPLPAGHTSPELRGRLALRPTGEMVPVQGASGDEARDEVDLRLTVDPRGDATGTVSIVLRGRPAQGLAESFETVVGTDRRDMLRRVVLGWLPWATVDDVALSSTEGSWQVSIKADVKIPSYAQGAGSSWVLPGLEPLHAVFPRPWVSTVGASFATRAGRQSALAIDQAFLYRVRRHVELPPGAKLAGSIPTVTVKTDHLEASRTGRTEGSAVDEEFALSLPTGTVPVDAYAQFAQSARRVDDGFLAGTRVVH